MQVLIYGLLAFYAIVMPMLFTNWYGLYSQEAGMSLNQRQTSRIVIMVATLLWPIVLPMSYLELLKKVKRYERQSRVSATNFATESY
jgi:uncharacterized membrane protein